MILFPELVQQQAGPLKLVFSDTTIGPEVGYALTMMMLTQVGEQGCNQIEIPLTTLDRFIDQYLEEEELDQKRFELLETAALVETLDKQIGVGVVAPLLEEWLISDGFIDMTVGRGFLRAMRLSHREKKPLELWIVDPTQKDN